jgi:hypothetical protein
MLDTIKSFCRRSLTIAWAYVLAAAGVLMQALPSVLDLLGAPEVSEAIKAVLPGPAVSVYTIGIAVVTYAARMRSLRQAG